MALVAVALLATSGCATSFVPTAKDLREMRGNDIHPVTVKNNSAYTIYVEGNYDYKPVKIGPSKSWVINTDKKTFVMTAMTTGWRGGCTLSSIRVGQWVKKVDRRTAMIVVDTADFPPVDKTSH